MGNQKKLSAFFDNMAYKKDDFIISIEKSVVLRNCYIQHQYEEIIKWAFNQGRSYDFREEDKGYKVSPSLYLQSLVYGYLKLLKAEFGALGRKNVVLLRHHGEEPLRDEGGKERLKGEIDLLNEKKWGDRGEFQGGIFIDSQGGILALDLPIRRKFFKIRSAFVRSLWDYSLKYKKKFF